MKRKPIVLAAALFLMLTLCACGSANSASAAGGQQASEKTQAPVQTAQADAPTKAPTAQPTTQTTVEPTVQPTATAVPTAEPTATPAQTSQMESTQVSDELTAINPNASPFEIAQQCVDQRVEVLIEKIGEPLLTEYAPSCVGPGEDGNLYYEEFVVYTYRENGEETVTGVE